MSLSTTDDSCDCDSSDDFDFAPDFRFHIIKENAPSIYTVFLPVAGAGLLITMIIILPHVWRIRQAGLRNRDKHEEILVAAPYNTICFICLYPVVQCICNFSSLLVPFSEPAMGFFASFYQGVCLFQFGRLLIMFFGNYKKAFDQLMKTEPHKVWAVPPLGCCFACCPCIPKRHVTEKDLRVMDTLISQNVIIAPMLSLISLFRQFQGGSTEIVVLSILSLVSLAFGLYGVMSLLTATQQAIEDRNPKGKFIAIQVMMVASQLVPSIVSAVGVPRVNSDYTKQVMSKAYSAFIVVIIVTCLSFLFRKFYTIEDCDDADSASRSRELAVEMVSPRGDQKKMIQVPTKPDEDP